MRYVLQNPGYIPIATGGSQTAVFGVCVWRDRPYCERADMVLFQKSLKKKKKLE